MKRISTGTENFKRIIDENYYYVDKTQLIETVMSQQVCLFTRPRRFGKTLNMSMLYYFFSNQEKENAYLFNDLKITKSEEIMKHQNQYPVIFITLKDIKALNFEDAIYFYKSALVNIASKYKEVLNNENLEEHYKYLFKKYLNANAEQSELKDSLKILSICLEKHYGQKVILLIDEYDVPLQHAYKNNYYDEMVDFISALFSSALKTNDSLFKGVMTGCLRISKESIFTGLNNFSVYSIFTQKASDCFGFTQNEIDEILNYYELNNKKESIKDWYDGYLFGKTEIYNPWSTLYCIRECLTDPNMNPTSYWANTSSNILVYDYIKNSNREIKDEFEQLVQGKSIIKRIKPELTYREMDNIDNIYSFLLFTGYLKVKNDLGNDTYELVIPNKEIYKIYENHFIEYFNEYTQERRNDFVDALIHEDIEKADYLLNEVLMNSISYHDYGEAFYHGLLIGLIKENVVSNQESGLGRYDVAYLPNSRYGTGFIIECKVSKIEDDLVEDSEKACQQIHEMKYMDGLKRKGYSKMKGYGIAFYKKSCYIVKA